MQIALDSDGHSIILPASSLLSGQVGTCYPFITILCCELFFLPVYYTFQGHYLAPDLHIMLIWIEMATQCEVHSEGIIEVGEG